MRQLMQRRLFSLKSIPKVFVRAEGYTIYIETELVHSAKFKFEWVNDHYVGYFIDSNEEFSQAIIALWNDFEAMKFVTLYFMLIELRAKRS